MRTTNRRNFNLSAAKALGFLFLAAHQGASALSLKDLSDKEVSQGLRLALEKGAQAAVSSLGKTDGFLGNEKVRIALPGHLHDAQALLSGLGFGKRLDELLTSMNRAAEAAVPMAKNLLLSAVKNMTVVDAKNVLTGGDTAVTTFFSDKTRSPLFNQFLPLVTKATQKVGVADKYNQIAGQASNLGLVRPEESNIQTYVTNKTLDGLFLVIGEEEKKIRQNPAGAANAVLSKVFGVLKTSR